MMHFNDFFETVSRNTKREEKGKPKMGGVSKDTVIAYAKTGKEKITTLWKSGKKGKCVIIVGVLFLLGLFGSFMDSEEKQEHDGTKTAVVSKNEKSAKKEAQSVKTNGKSILKLNPKPKDFDKLYEKYCRKPPYFGSARRIREGIESLFKLGFRTPVTEEMAKVDPKKPRLTLFGGSLQLGDEYVIPDERMEAMRKLLSAAEETEKLEKQLNDHKLSDEERRNLKAKQDHLLLQTEFQPETVEKVLAIDAELKKIENSRAEREALFRKSLSSASSRTESRRSSGLSRRNWGSQQSRKEEEARKEEMASSRKRHEERQREIETENAKEKELLLERNVTILKEILANSPKDLQGLLDAKEKFAKLSPPSSPLDESARQYYKAEEKLDAIIQYNMKKYGYGWKSKGFTVDIGERHSGVIMASRIVNWHGQMSVSFGVADHLQAKHGIMFFDGFASGDPLGDGSRMWSGPLPRPFKKFAGIEKASYGSWYQAPNSNTLVLYAVSTEKGDTESHEAAKTMRERLTKIVKDKHPGIKKGYSNECWEEYILNGDMMKIEQQASAEQAGMSWAVFFDKRPGITVHMIRPSIIAELLKTVDQMEQKELDEVRKLEAAGEKALEEGF